MVQILSLQLLVHVYLYTVDSCITYRKTSDSSRVPYTSRAPDTGRVRVQAGRVMVLAYLPQSASVDVCKHGIAKSSETQIDMY